MSFSGILLSHANSAVNPVVYAYRIPKIQQAYAQIWRSVLVVFDCRYRDRHVEQSRTASRTNRSIETCGSGGKATP